MQPEKAERFYDFLGEYADFFANMEQFEQRKLSVLLSGNLPDIENAISSAQANAKKLENLEAKRIRMQEEAGLGTMSLSELAALAEGERSTQLLQQLRRLTSCVHNIRFYNQKSMEVAQTNLRRYGTAQPQHEPPGYGGHREAQNDSSSRLEVKA